MAQRWRLINDEPHDGFYNMAVDESLFKYYQRYKVPAFRIYSWLYPFLTIGFRQNISDITFDDDKVCYTKRITGGGAILHANELTYSMVLGKETFPESYNIKQMYKFICGFLIFFYSSLGARPKFAGDVFPDKRLGEPSAFCFLKYEHYDLLINGKKIGGNAQRWSGRNLLQHGSIPIISPNDGVSTAICDFCGSTDKKILARQLIASFKKYFSVDLVPDELSKEERRFANKRAGEMRAIYDEEIKLSKTILAR